MEELNIIDILKNKDKGIKLFDSVLGESVIFDRAEDNCILCFYKGCIQSYKGNGKIVDNKDAIVVLTPSREMCDLSKFAWKKGDILIQKEECCTRFCVFDTFKDDKYTTFIGKYYNIDNPNFYTWYQSIELSTKEFHKATDKEAQEIIKEIEEVYNGKLNLSTLEIEKPEFKDGDIVFMKGIKAKSCANCIFILRGKYKTGDKRAFYYAFYNVDDNFVLSDFDETRVHYSLRPATDSEKQQLFDALAKKAKRWNVETKQIEYIKKEHEFKPFDRVLVRDENEDKWVAQLFSHVKKDAEYPYVCISDPYKQCIPYNEKTMHLLGTNDDYEEGGSDE